MIFVTVGGQLAFDRLVLATDAWARARNHDSVFAQVGHCQEPPGFIAWQQFLTRSEFTEKMREADIVVAHAGMGTILTALHLGKRIVVMPRRAHLGEHRNDHQWATVSRLPAHLGVQVARDAEELAAKLDSPEKLPHASAGSSPERSRLIAYLRTFVSS